MRNDRLVTGQPGGSRILLLLLLVFQVPFSLSSLEVTHWVLASFLWLSILMASSVPIRVHSLAQESGASPDASPGWAVGHRGGEPRLSMQRPSQTFPWAVQEGHTLCPLDMGGFWGEAATVKTESSAACPR